MYQLREIRDWNFYFSQLRQLSLKFGNPCYHFFIYPQKWQFRFENKNFENSQNSAYLYLLRTWFISYFSQVMNHDIWLIWYGEYENNPHLWQKEKWRASMKNQENHMPTYNSKAESKSALWKDNPLASIRKMEVSTWKSNLENFTRESHFGRFCTSSLDGLASNTSRRSRSIFLAYFVPGIGPRFSKFC